MKRIQCTLALVAILVCGCGGSEWGNRCEKDGDCGDPALFCDKPDEGNISGYCRNAGGELRCGPGTVLRGSECLPDPEAEPVVCGPGTEEVNGRCIPSQPDAGVDAGDDAG